MGAGELEIMAGTQVGAADVTVSAESLTLEEAIANLRSEDASLRYYAAWWVGRFRVDLPEVIQMSSFGQQKGYRNNPYSNKNGYSNQVYRDARFMIAVRKPIKLAEKVDYDDIKNNMVQVMTPDIEDFASKIVDASNKKELCQTAKILAMTKGFRLVVPYAKQESRITLM